MGRQLINPISVKTKACLHYEVMIDIAFSPNGSSAIEKNENQIRASLLA